MAKVLIKVVYPTTAGGVGVPPESVGGVDLFFTGTPGGTLNPLTTLNAPETNFTSNELVPGSYEFAAQAFDTAGVRGEVSDRVSLLIPTPVVPLDAPSLTVTLAA